MCFLNSGHLSFHLKMDFNWTIVVDKNLRTSAPSIYAIGDLIKIPLLTNNENYYLPLIANARKEGLIAAYNLTHEAKISYPASKKIVSTKLFDNYLGSCGITESEAVYYDIPHEVITKEYLSLSTYGEFQDSFLHIKLIYNPRSLVILGAQLMTNNHTLLESINQL